MEANLLLVDLLEAKYRDEIIVTWWPYAQMLASETFCYVNKPFQVVTAGRPCLRWRNTASLDELDVDDLLRRQDVIWVWSDSCFSVVNAFNPATDRVVDSIQVGDRTILLFRRTPAAFRSKWRK